MYKLLSIILFLTFSIPALGRHIIGGEMYYNYIGKTANGYQYEIVLKLYRGCEPEDEQHSLLDPSATFTIFDEDKNSYTTTGEIKLDHIKEISNNFHDPCIHNAPTSCYRIGYYKTTVTLPLNSQGYTIAYQRCCRDNALLNANTSNNVGATYFTNIPGLATGIPGDNSPRFDKEEAILICSRGNIDYTFEANDPDGDELRYDFVSGYIGGSQNNLAPIPTSAPPFPKMSYFSGFSGAQPLGEDVTIDPITGRISGRTHLQPGSYDITIRVRAYRGGDLIATHLHDFQFHVNDCKREVLADIPPLYNDCSSKTIHFDNNSTLNKDYVWDFDDGTTSTLYKPTHTFQDTGTYHVWLKVNPLSNCGDSLETIVKIYPKLKPDFEVSDFCIQSPIQFKDNSSTVEGKIDTYEWSFGNQSITSSQKDPKHTFSTGGKHPVKLTVSTDLGCEQSIEKEIDFYDPPSLEVSTDTVICQKDPFQLEASSSQTGQYLWTTNYNLSNPNIADPIATPQKDTTYKVVFTDKHGCTNTGKVHLRVQKNLQVSAGKDTTICAGDPVNLHAKSDGDYAFAWYDAQNNLVQKGRNINPTTSDNQTYQVVATLGSCIAKDTKKVTAIPYPKPEIHPANPMICYGDNIKLTGSGGSIYHWSPTTNLTDPNASSIFLQPDTTTIYTLTVKDTKGCPKSVDKQVKITVEPPVQAFAGRDTIITIGQQFQLQGRGGDEYHWTPAQGLSNPNIANPLAHGNKDISYSLKVLTQPVGCVGYDTINIRYIEGPEVYVPTAFSPNGDGQNDIFRPIPVGVTKILYFRVYDRWGNLVYQTTDYMQGWDGTYKGKPATLGSYVWMVKVTDFNGHDIVKKGSVLLVR